MSNPCNLLPDCSAIRGKLQKLELSKKSINKYLDSNEDPSDFNCSQFVFNKNMKKISSRNVISPILDQFTTVTSVPTEPKRFDFYFKEFQNQYDSKENVAENNGFCSPTCDIKETQSDPFCNDEIQNYLKYVSRFECSCCQWLVLKENFQTHLSFCQNKFKKQEGNLVTVSSAPTTFTNFDKEDESAVVIEDSDSYRPKIRHSRLKDELDDPNSFRNRVQKETSTMLMRMK